MMPRVDRHRRRCVQAIAALIATRMLPAHAAGESMPAIPALANYVAGKPVRWERVKLELPQLADNGLVVPTKIAVAGPFAAGAHVASLRLFSEINPVPEMAVFEYASPVARVELDTRIRLAGTQKIVVIATLADGTLLGAMADVVVTVAGCMDGT